MKKFIKPSVAFERNFHLQEEEDNDSTSSSEQEEEVIKPTTINNNNNRTSLLRTKTLTKTEENDADVIDRLFTDQERIIMNERLKEMNNSFQKTLSKIFPVKLPYEITENDIKQVNSSQLLSDEEAKSISCNLFTKGFFKEDEETGAIVLDKTLIGEKDGSINNTPFSFLSRAEITNSKHFKQSNDSVSISKQLLYKDVNGFLEKHSVLNGVEDKLYAPLLKSKKDLSKTQQEEQEKIVSLLDPNYSSSTIVKKKDNLGKNWFNMPAPRMTPELKQELMAIKLKNAAESEGKKLKKDKVIEEDELSKLPKYFQIGTIVDNPKEFYSDRVVKKKRQQSFLDELIQEDKETGYVTNRYHEIQDKLNAVQKRKKDRIIKQMKKKIKK
ncbi:hypothetical protein ABK040_007978 [Willaertia magna]